MTGSIKFRDAGLWALDARVRRTARSSEELLLAVWTVTGIFTVSGCC